MINFDDYTNKNKTKHNLKWLYITDHPYRILIIGGSSSGKTKVLLNLINNQPDTDKIYLYVKDPNEAKYKYLINKNDDLKAFIEFPNYMQDGYKNIEEYSLGKKRKY